MAYSQYTIDMYRLSSGSGANYVSRLFYAGTLIVLGGCSSNPGKTVESPGRVAALQHLNVVLVTIDTLRADRIGCYGNTNAETPELDRFARSGLLFQNAIAQAPLTTPSHASMMTGLYPTVHKVRDAGGFVLSPSHATLATILQDQGWDTAAFVGASVLKKRFGLQRGFSVYDDEMPKSDSQTVGSETPERRAAVVIGRAISWLEAQSGKPFFLWVHLYDPHLPYTPPAPFREKYKGREYDGEIAYTDREVGRLFRAVVKKSGPEKTLTAVLSDHGESFSEHGEYSHGVFIYDSTLRIPFIISGPGIPAGTRVRQQARTIDLLPTFMDLMGGKTPSDIQGVSLKPAFRGVADPAPNSYVESMYPRLNMGWAELRGIRTNDWKYVRAPSPELYHLTEDPAESRNVIGSYPAEAQKLEASLQSVSNVAEKLETSVTDQHTTEQLRSLGYIGGAGKQEYELTGKGIDPKNRIDVLKQLYLSVYSSLPLSRRIAGLAQALAIDPSNASLYYNLGDLYGQAGRAADAMQIYRQAIARGVRTSWLYSRLGLLSKQQGKREDALALFEAAAQLNPSDYESLCHLAPVYRESGRYAEAERICQSILKTGEEYAPAYNELGMLAFQKGNVRQAREYFEKAAQLDSAFQLNLARLYKMAGENTRARASYELFLRDNASRLEYRAVVPSVKQELSELQ